MERGEKLYDITARLNLFAMDEAMVSSTIALTSVVYAKAVNDVQVLKFTNF